MSQDKNAMKIKFTKHPYPESLDADDAPPQLVSFSVSESECEYVYIFYTLDNAAGRAAPARAAGRAKGVYGESPYYFITHFNIFYTLHPSLNRGMGLGVWFGVWGWGLGLGLGFAVWGVGFGVWVRGWVLGFGAWVWGWGLGLGFGVGF